MKKIYFEIEYPDNQILDDAAVESGLRSAIEEIIPNSVLRTSAEGMNELEQTMAAETKNRIEEGKIADKRVKATGEEAARRVAKFSDEDLPYERKFLSKEFREQYKMSVVLEQLAQEEEN